MKKTFWVIYAVLFLMGNISCQGLKTYRSEQFHFEVRYPANWRLYPASGFGAGTIAIQIDSPPQYSGDDRSSCSIVIHSEYINDHTLDEIKFIWLQTGDPLVKISSFFFV